MRLLILTASFPNKYDEIAGIFIKQQMLALKEYLEEIVVINPTPYSPLFLTMFSRKCASFRNTPLLEIVDGVTIYHPKIIRFPNNYFNRLSDYLYYLGIKKALKFFIAKKNDIIHAHNMFPDGYSAMKLSKTLKIPYIVTVHGQNFNHDIYENNKSKNAIMKKIIYMAEKIIVVGRVLKDNALKIFGSETKDKICVINNGIGSDIIECANKNVNKQRNSKITIVSVSGLTKSKGVDLNIAAINQLKNRITDIEYEYLIIGDGPERKNLQSLVDGYGLNDKIKVLGKLSRKETIEVIRNADIFSLPSWREGFGIVYIEAMAFGVSVIGIKGQGIADVIENNYDGYLVEPSVEALCEVLYKLMTNRQLRLIIGGRARNKVVGSYTWEENAKKYKDLYEGIIRENKEVVS